MQIMSVKIKQHEISMKELCSKVPASFAVLRLVGGYADDGSFWGGDVMHHLFPLLVGIKVEENITTPYPHNLSKSPWLLYWNVIPCLPLPMGTHAVHRHFSLCCEAPGLMYLFKASPEAISTLNCIILLPL